MNEQVENALGGHGISDIYTNSPVSIPIPETYIQSEPLYTREELVALAAKAIRTLHGLDLAQATAIADLVLQAAIATGQLKVRG